MLVTARISPVGPALAGLVYLALAGWLAADPERVRQVLLGLYPAGDPMLLRPAEGLAALLGVPLVATVLRTRRWRHYRGMIALYAGADDADRTDQRPVSVSPEHPRRTGRTTRSSRRTRPRRRTGSDRPGRPAGRGPATGHRRPRRRSPARPRDSARGSATTPPT
ncbi:hypothetical protein [Micromonospora zhanjiangensis]